MQRHDLFIDGSWVATDATLPVTNPATGEVIAQLSDATRGHVDDAVGAARSTFDAGDWSSRTPADRRSLVTALADALESRRDEIIDTLVADTGCPIRLARALQFGSAVAAFRDLSERALRVHTEDLGVRTTPSFGHQEVQYAPKGVVAAVVPFNFPLLVSAWKLAPALVTGNTVVLKPSPLAPSVGSILGRAAHEAGLPRGVLNVVQGGLEASTALVSHPHIDHITFTGSTTTGAAILAATAPNIVSTTLELGGKSPAIILADADIELAARGCAMFGFMHAGQVCAAMTRILVAREIFHEFTARFVELASSIVVGAPEDPATDIGPLISEEQLQRVEARLDRARQEGATILCGGTRIDDRKGSFFRPTVVTDTDNHSDICRNELFGPVICVVPFDSPDEAVQLANDNPYGLAASVWGRDLRQLRSLASRIRAGTVAINDCGVSSPDAPFGGFKQSGIGRERGRTGALEFTEPRWVYTAMDNDVTTRPYAIVGSKW